MLGESRSDQIAIVLVSECTLYEQSDQDALSHIQIYNIAASCSEAHKMTFTALRPSLASQIFNSWLFRPRARGLYRNGEDTGECPSFTDAATLTRKALRLASPSNGEGLNPLSLAVGSGFVPLQMNLTPNSCRSLLPFISCSRSSGRHVRLQ